MPTETRMLDRNKTELTHKVTAAVYRYMDERGFKPLETEVPICEGWIADLAGSIIPTQSELQELKLLSTRPRYRQYTPEVKIVQDEWYAKAKEMQHLMTMLVEVKTSRADFRGDKKWELPIPTNLAYLAIPSDLVIDVYPCGWGILEYVEVSDSVRRARPPAINYVRTGQQLDVVLNVAIRRDHHTRYERVREFRREETIQRNEDVSRKRINDCMRAMFAIVNGSSLGGRIPHASVEEALEYCGIKKLSQFDCDQLRTLWKIAAPEATDAH